jgi:hypothetical protein
MFTSTLDPPLRRIALPAALAAVVAALALPALASADPSPTSVKLSQSAQFSQPWEIDTQVTLSCTPGFGYWVNVSVVQPQGWGFTLFGGGQTGGQCTGQQQKVAVAVFRSATSRGCSVTRRPPSRPAQARAAATRKQFTSGCSRRMRGGPAAPPRNS